MSEEPQETTAPASPPAPASTPEARPDLDDTPPVLGSWRNIYITVLGVLAVLVALFALLTRAYS